MDKYQSKMEDYKPASNWVLLAGILGGAIVVIGIAIAQIVYAQDLEDRWKSELERHDCKLETHDFGRGCRPGRVCYACSDGIQRCK